MKRETLHGINRLVLLFVLIASMVLPFVQIRTKEANFVTQSREMIERSLIYQTVTLPHPIPGMEGSDYLQGTKSAEGLSSPRHHREGLGVGLLVLVYLAGLTICHLRYFWQMAALLLMIRRSNRIKIEGMPSQVHVVTNTSVKALLVGYHTVKGVTLQIAVDVVYTLCYMLQTVYVFNTFSHKSLSCLYWQ